MANANLDFRHWEFFDDDATGGDPDTCTSNGGEDPSTPPTLGVSTAIMLRVALQETASRNDSGTVALQFQKNGSGGYSDIASTGQTGKPVRAYGTGGSATDGALCDTNLLTVDSGAFAATGVYEETTPAQPVAFTVEKDNSHECQWCIELYDDGNWQSGDYVEFQCAAATGITVSNTATARLDFDAGDVGHVMPNTTVLLQSVKTGAFW